MSGLFGVRRDAAGVERRPSRVARALARRHALGLCGLLGACGTLPGAIPARDVAATEAPTPRASTAGPGVQVLTPPLRMARFGAARTLRIYLPPGYAESTRRHPVLYLFDAQNLFDDATSYAGEWGVDETLDARARAGSPVPIVVGLDHGQAARFSELIPYLDLRFLPNDGQAFVADLVESIKPFVDANYRTRPQRAHTAIGGSSLGGLAADYAIHAHPQVFSMAMVFSPSYWVSDVPLHVARTRPLPTAARVYLYVGGGEGVETVDAVRAMAAALRTHDAESVALHVDPVAGHDEKAWRAAFPEAIRWFFGERPAASGER